MSGHFLSDHLFEVGVKTKCVQESLLGNLAELFDRWRNETIIAKTTALTAQFERTQIFDLLHWIQKHNIDEIRVYAWYRCGSADDYVMMIPAGVYLTVANKIDV